MPQLLQYPTRSSDLQQSLTNVETWCAKNAMVLNVSKCHIVSFTRLAVCHTFDYSIGGEVLKRRDRVKDLGVIFTSTLSRADHINYIVSRANCILGFILRSTRNFRSPHTLLILYKALVRPVLEYGSTIWSPYQLGHIEKINRVQDRFVRVLGIRLGYDYHTSPVLELQMQFGILPLHLRRQALDLTFLYKLINGGIDSANLLLQIDFHVSRGTRTSQFFTRAHRPTNYAYNSGLTRLRCLGNEVGSQLDFFNDSLLSFRRKVNLSLEWLEC